MKRIKRIVSMMLTVVMVMAMTLTASASSPNNGDGQQPATGDGSITINGSETVPVSGKTFNAYQILNAELANGADATGGVVYRVPEALKTFYADKYGLDSTKASFDQDVTEKIAALKDNAEGLEQFAKDVLQAAKDAGITPHSVTAGEKDEKVTISNLPLGYYVVEDVGTATPISALALDTTAKDMSINVKADKPSIDKNIDATTDTDPENNEDEDGLVKDNNAAIGDKVPYVVTSKVPDMTGYTKYAFVVTDILSKGLDFNEDDLVIQVGNAGFEEDDVDPMATTGSTTLTKEEDYKLTVTKNEDGTTTVEIVFVDFYGKYRGVPGADIVIKYSATINKDAVIGIEGNPNKVKLEYSNNPNKQPEWDTDNPDKPTTPVGETPESITRTFVTGIELQKVDKDGNFLAGAEFTIEGTRINKVLVSKTEFKLTSEVGEDDVVEEGDYYKLKDGTYTQTAPNVTGGDDDNSEAYESTEQIYKKVTVKEVQEKAENVKTTGTVDASTGILTFEGLSAGVYTITEIKAPNGYNLLKEPIEITITYQGPGSDVENPDACVWGFEVTKGPEGFTNNVTMTGSNVGIIAVLNQSGSLLPSTGGIGTTIFYVIGGILVIGAGVLLVAKRRMKAQ